MILKYKISDNKLEKVNPTDYPTHLQDNIVLQFEDVDGIINDKTYAYIKTHDKVQKVKIIKNGDLCACELPYFTTVDTFFKLRVLVNLDEHKMFTNEVIVPIRVNDYLDFNRSIHYAMKPRKKWGKNLSHYFKKLNEL